MRNSNNSSRRKSSSRRQIILVVVIVLWTVLTAVSSIYTYNHPHALQIVGQFAVAFITPVMVQFWKHRVRVLEIFLEVLLLLVKILKH